MSEQREPPGGEVMLDSDGLAVLVQVVSASSEQMSAIVGSNPVPPPRPAEAFGDLAAGWLEFHQAWNQESASSARGLANFADQIQRSAAEFHRADERGGVVVNGSSSQSGE